MRGDGQGATDVKKTSGNAVYPPARSDREDLRDVNDSDNAEHFATQSVAVCVRRNRSRRASLSYAVLAASHQQRKDLEAAAATRALDLASDVPSIRCAVALNGISAEFAPHTQNYAVETFMTRLKQTQRI